MPIFHRPGWSCAWLAPPPLWWMHSSSHGTSTLSEVSCSPRLIAEWKISKLYYSYNSFEGMIPRKCGMWLKFIIWSNRREGRWREARDSTSPPDPLRCWGASKLWELSPGCSESCSFSPHIVYQDLLLGSSLYPAGVSVSPLVASLLPCFILFISLLLFIYVCLSEGAFIVFVLFCFANWASISPKLGKMANFPLRSCRLWASVGTPWGERVTRC